MCDVQEKINMPLITQAQINNCEKMRKLEEEHYKTHCYKCGTHIAKQRKMKGLELHECIFLCEKCGKEMTQSEFEKMFVGEET
jgi:predicted Zn-ribbon and HTH transcriptional regulator